MFGFGKATSSQSLIKDTDPTLVNCLLLLPFFKSQTIDIYLEKSAPILTQCKEQTIIALKEMKPEDIIVQLIDGQIEILKSVSEKNTQGKSKDTAFMMGLFASSGHIGNYVFARSPAISLQTGAPQLGNCYHYGKLFIIMLNDNRKQFNPDFHDGCVSAFNLIRDFCANELGLDK